MKVIPTPDQIGSFDLMDSATHQSRVDTVLDRFITAVATGDFHYISSVTEAVVMYPAEGDYCKPEVWKDAIACLQGAGWKVRHAVRTCANGWFNGIMLER